MAAACLTHGLENAHSLSRFIALPSESLMSCLQRSGVSSWRLQSNCAAEIGKHCSRRLISTQTRKYYHTMDAATALTQSMDHMTTTKLTALSQQQQRYETNKSQILEAVAGKGDMWEKVEALLDGYEEYKVPVPSSISAANVRRFLKQSRHDHSVSPSLLQGWQTTLEQALDVPSRKYKHASLFGRLVMEWLGKAEESPSNLSGSGDIDPFEHVGRKEMYDQRKEWESIVFADDSKSDPAAIEAYLASLFSSVSQAKRLTKSPLETLREKLESFELGTCDVDNLKTCITGVLNTDLLSDSKRKTLSEFAGNSIILREIVDVLNMQIDDIDSWGWGTEAVSVDVRRALNGKYRIYMDEEILQALLLHFIGTKWAVHLKSAFLEFFGSGAWKQSPRRSMDRQARQRRRDFLGYTDNDSQSVRNERRDRYQREYFLLQLPTSFDVQTDNYDEEPVEGYSRSRSPMAIKQSLLHLISTEALVNTRLYGSFTVLQSDFRWFGPSLSHNTILTVLRFFGASERWLKFFEKFLKAPIKFTMDGPDSQTKIRRSGVPIQHQLSDALGEAVLFGLDFAVNKATESNLYRLHDDIWFWGDKDTTVKAWHSIREFADVMGLRLNEGKTGAVELSGHPVSAREFSASDALPSGPITWGFMKIGSSGTWTIDDAQVDAHTKELKLQLGACKSIFSWIQSWNAYVARFISNNFGEPANCLGRPHIDMVIEAFQKIQSGLFAADGLTGENAIGHLRAKLSTRFGIADVPDGFFLFPVDLGGLGLINPLVSLFLVYEKSLCNPASEIEKAIEDEEYYYERAKKDWTDGKIVPTHDRISAPNEEFLSLEEYTSYLEETSAPLHRAYGRLMDAPSQTLIDHTPDVVSAQKPLPTPLVRGSHDDWVVQLYGPEIVRRYGGLAMGEKRLLPIGLVDMLRKEKVRWQS